MRKLRVIRVSLTLLMAVMVVGGMLPQLALGNPFGTVGTSCGRLKNCWYDGTHQRYWYDGSVGSAWKNAGEYARVTEVDGTVISTNVVSGHDNSDVAVYMYTDPNDTLYGYSDCISWTGVLCGHWHENFNTAYGPYTETQRKSIACHEFGHTVGLHHYETHQSPQTCIENLHFHLHWNGHDINHVNNYYG